MDIDFVGLVIHRASLFIYGSARDRYGCAYLPLGIPSLRTGKMVSLMDEDRVILFNPEGDTHKNYPINSCFSLSWQ